MSKNKENFRLLDLSSDEESEELQLDIHVPRKKRITRRDRSRGAGPRTPEPNLKSEVKTALVWAMRGTVTLWLLALTWTCAAMYEQVTAMRSDIVQVSTSSAGVGDALQVCHTAARELRANASSLAARLAALEEQHAELARRVEGAAGRVAELSEQLAAAPRLADTPAKLLLLERTVADFGSQIKGFDGALQSAQQQAKTAAAGVEEVRGSLHDLQLRANETDLSLAHSAARGEELAGRVGVLNSTVLERVGALETRIEQASRATTTVAPPAPAPAATRPSPSLTLPAAAAGNISTTATAAAPPGPPAKPSILQ